MKEGITIYTTLWKLLMRIGGARAGWSLQGNVGGCRLRVLLCARFASSRFTVRRSRSVGDVSLWPDMLLSLSQRDMMGGGSTGDAAFEEEQALACWLWERSVSSLEDDTFRRRLDGATSAATLLPQLWLSHRSSLVGVVFALPTRHLLRLGRCLSASAMAGIDSNKFSQDLALRNIPCFRLCNRSSLVSANWVEDTGTCCSLLLLVAFIVKSWWARYYLGCVEINYDAGGSHSSCPEFDLVVIAQARNQSHATTEFYSPYHSQAQLWLGMFVDGSYVSEGSSLVWRLKDGQSNQVSDIFSINNVRRFCSFYDQKYGFGEPDLYSITMNVWEENLMWGSHPSENTNREPQWSN